MSVRAVSWSDGIENFTKLCSVSLSVLEKDIPLVFILLRYLMTCLAWVTCPSVGREEYFARILVIGAISGLVDVESQLREPTIDRYFCVRCACLAGVY